MPKAKEVPSGEAQVQSQAAWLQGRALREHGQLQGLLPRGGT